MHGVPHDATTPCALPCALSAPLRAFVGALSELCALLEVVVQALDFVNPRIKDLSRLEFRVPTTFKPSGLADLIDGGVGATGEGFCLC